MNINNKIFKKTFDLYFFKYNLYFSLKHIKNLFLQITISLLFNLILLFGFLVKYSNYSFFIIEKKFLNNNLYYLFCSFFALICIFHMYFDRIKIFIINLSSINILFIFSIGKHMSLIAFNYSLEFITPIQISNIVYFMPVIIQLTINRKRKITLIESVFVICMIIYFTLYVYYSEGIILYAVFMSVLLHIEVKISNKINSNSHFYIYLLIFSIIGVCFLPVIKLLHYFELFFNDISVLKINFYSYYINTLCYTIVYFYYSYYMQSAFLFELQKGELIIYSFMFTFLLEYFIIKDASDYIENINRYKLNCLSYHNILYSIIIYLYYNINKKLDDEYLSFNAEGF